MAYPIIPTVNPGKSNCLLFNAPAITGTKGGEQIKAVEVIIMVSESIPNNFDSAKCKAKVANNTKET